MTRPLFTRLRFVAVLAVIATASALPQAAARAAPAPVTIHIANFAFMPATITVPAGATVTWINDDDDAHSVISDTGVFHSAALDTGDKYSFTFTVAGDYAYHCGLHPHMVAKVLVRP